MPANLSRVATGRSTMRDKVPSMEIKGNLVIKRQRCHLMIKTQRCHLVIERQRCHLVIERQRCHLVIERQRCHLVAGYETMPDHSQQIPTL
jgi:hypothetical protein